MPPKVRFIKLPRVRAATPPVKPSRPSPMWTAEEALALIHEIHPCAFRHGWNLHLGGGLATGSGTSNHDADVLAMPRCQTKVAHHDYDAVIEHLHTLGWVPVGPWGFAQFRRIATLQKAHRILELIFVDLT